MELLGIGNLTYNFLEKGTKYVSIIITIIGNITALVSDSVIFFGYFMSMSHGVIKKSPPSASSTSSPYQVFPKFVCCFTINIEAATKSVL